MPFTQLLRRDTYTLKWTVSLKEIPMIRLKHNYLQAINGGSNLILLQPPATEQLCDFATCNLQLTTYNL